MAVVRAEDELSTANCIKYKHCVTRDTLSVTHARFGVILHMYHCGCIVLYTHVTESFSNAMRGFRFVYRCLLPAQYKNTKRHTHCTSLSLYHSPFQDHFSCVYSPVYSPVYSLQPQARAYCLSSSCRYLDIYT